MAGGQYFCESCCLEDCLQSKKQDRSQYGSPECVAICDGPNPPWGMRTMG